MLRVAVQLPAAVVTPGEFLADVQAYEAAGADAIWLGPATLEPLTLVAAAAAVTYRAALAAPVPAPWPAGVLKAVVATLDRLSRGRLVLSFDGAAAAEDLVAALREAGGERLLATGAEPAAWMRAARLADGLVSDRASAAEAFERVRALRRPRGEAEEAADRFELWVRAPAPGGRSEWHETLAACEALGATGVVVAHAPNLLDILRNPDEDDRHDLAMAVG